jgi:hypothetical protein
VSLKADIEETAMAWGFIVVFVAVVTSPYWVWALFATGGLYEAKQMNPAYAHSDKNLSEIISTIEWSRKTDDLFDPVLEYCAPHMPEWDDALLCMRADVDCMNKTSQPSDYWSCMRQAEPAHGPLWLLRRSRYVIRDWLADGMTDPAARRWAELGR